MCEAMLYEGPNCKIHICIFMRRGGSCQGSTLSIVKAIAVYLDLCFLQLPMNLEDRFRDEGSQDLGTRGPLG